MEGLSGVLQPLCPQRNLCDAKLCVCLALSFCSTSRIGFRRCNFAREIIGAIFCVNATRIL
jgi:hypothetical protein